MWYAPRHTSIGMINLLLVPLSPNVNYSFRFVLGFKINCRQVPRNGANQIRFGPPADVFFYQRNSSNCTFVCTKHRSALIAKSIKILKSKWMDRPVATERFVYLWDKWTLRYGCTVYTRAHTPSPIQNGNNEEISTYIQPAYIHSIHSQWHTRIEPVYTRLLQSNRIFIFFFFFLSI